MAMLSIPSYKTDDPNYRYKMPRLVAKVEGRGNGIKTNIVNMGDIARALKRPPDYPTRFCGVELGAQSKFDPAEGKAIVNGAHEQRDLQVLIDKFVEKFVLCDNCRLPEIDLIVKKGRVQYHCNACGQKGEVDNAHKLSTFILKNPPGGSDSTMGSKKKSATSRREERAQKARSKTVQPDESDPEDNDIEKKKKKKSKKDDKDADEKSSKSKKSRSKDSSGDNKRMDTLGGGDLESTDESDVVKTAPDDDGKKKKKKSSKKSKGGGVDQVEELDQLTYSSPETVAVIRRMLDFLCTAESQNSTALQIDTAVTPDMFFDQLRVLQMAQGLDHTLKFFVALQVLFASELRGLTASTLEQRIKYLKPVAAHTNATDILTALQDFIYLCAGSNVVPEGFKAYSAILYAFYDNDMLSGDGILKFYSEKAMKKCRSDRHEHAAEAMAAAAEAAQPILDWLEESDDESDDDAGSDSSPEENGASVPMHAPLKSLGTVEKHNGVLLADTKSAKIPVTAEDESDSDIDVDAL